MGILKNIIRYTPFFNAYKRYHDKRNEKLKHEEESKLLPLKVTFYKQFLEVGDLVFDVGANVGNRVEAFLQCSAKVIAVEPQPTCVNILQAKFEDKIIIENVGLSDEEGELEMQIASDSTVSSFNKDYINKTKERFKYSTWESTIKVPITTMDKLIAKYGIPKFCKIDVEGFELQVLRGLHSKIPYISFEYCLPEMQEQTLACIQYLHSISPNATFNLSIEESMTLAMKEWMCYEDFIAFAKTDKFIKTSFGDIYVKSS